MRSVDPMILTISQNEKRIPTWRSYPRPVAGVCDPAAGAAGAAGERGAGLACGTAGGLATLLPEDTHHREGSLAAGSAAAAAVVEPRYPAATVSRKRLLTFSGRTAKGSLEIGATLRLLVE